MSNITKRKFSTKLAGQIGEALVVAELGRRGIVATAFAGNVPDIDLLAYFGGKTLPLQVKAFRGVSMHLNAARYLKITMEGSLQKIDGIDTELDSELIYVFVKIGNRLGEDRFFILTQGELQKIIHDHHSAYLEKHKGIRPRNPESKHVGLLLSDLQVQQDRWDVIEGRLINEWL